MKIKLQDGGNGERVVIQTCLKVTVDNQLNLNFKCGGVESTKVIQKYKHGKIK